MKGKKTGGRKPGSKNKMTLAAREAFQYAFEKIGGADKLASWAGSHLSEFYKIYGKLIPMEVTGPGGGEIQTVVKHVYESVAAKKK